MLNFVGNGRCSRALDWSAEAAFREAGFRANQTIMTNFYVIIKSLLPVLTVKMVLLLHIIEGGGSPQLYYHDCSGTTSQVTPQGGRV